MESDEFKFVHDLEEEEEYSNQEWEKDTQLEDYEEYCSVCGCAKDCGKKCDECNC
jgi:hypothetical protein